MKYHIYESTAIVKKEEIRGGCTLCKPPFTSKIKETFSTKEKAIEKLKEYQTLIILSGTGNQPVYKVTEYFVEEISTNVDLDTDDQDIMWYSSFPKEYQNKWCVMDYNGCIAGKDLSKEAADDVLRNVLEKQPKNGWVLFHQIFDEQYLS